MITFYVLLLASCLPQKASDDLPTDNLDYQQLRLSLDTINRTEQVPIRKRDSLMRIYGANSVEVQKYQDIYERNHEFNEEKIKHILDQYGWPNGDSIGEQGNRVFCNVLQHSDSSVRIAYLPMMREAVKNNNLQPTLLVRAEDRIRTDRGETQLYGGQMKYYPETKSFNVWPVYDPINIDKRRAAIGLGPIAEYLQNRFDFEWNLEEQIKRTRAFEEEGINQ